MTGGPFSESNKRAVRTALEGLTSLKPPASGVTEALEEAYDILDGIYGGDGVTEAGAALLEQAMARILRVINEEVA